MLSVLYNDVTLLQFDDDGERILNWISGERTERIFGKDSAKITIPSDEAEAFARAAKRQEVGFAFSIPSTFDANQYISDAAPLIDSGRLIIRPDRLLSYTTGELTPQGGRHWRALNTNDDLEPDVWAVRDERDENSISYNEESFSKYYGANKTIENITKLSLPYIAGINLTDYSRILDDETDLLTEFRAEMKKLSSVEIEDLDIYRQDVLDPRVAAINRKFRQITRMKTFRAGGAFVATAGLVVGSVMTGGVAGAVSALAGSAGIIMGVKELADHDRQLGELKADPLFILWKLRRAK